MNNQQPCLNCNTLLRDEDKFCAQCGQEKKPLKITFWEFVTAFLSSNFNFDTKLGRTLTDLLLKPGEITRQFVAGKRVRYVKPVQLYFFFSFVFFLLLGLDPASFVNKTPPNQQQINELNQNSIAQINITSEEVNNITELFDTADPASDADMDSVLVKLGNTDIKPWHRHVIRQAIKSMRSDHDAQLSNEVYANLSVGMFFLLPLFAGLVWLFSKSQAPYYMDALVFAIHVHCVAFILFSLDVLTAFITSSSVTTKLFFLLLLVHFIVAFKRVYQFSWRASIGKTIGITALYLLAFGASFILIVLLSFWLF